MAEAFEENVKKLRELELARSSLIEAAKHERELLITEAKKKASESLEKTRAELTKYKNERLKEFEKELTEEAASIIRRAQEKVRRNKLSLSGRSLLKEVLAENGGTYV